MKKIIIYFFCFILICFTIPIILTNRQVVEKESKPVEEKKEPVVHKDYGTVKLLHTGTGEVETLSMNEYLYRSCISRNASRF